MSEDRRARAEEVAKSINMYEQEFLDDEFETYRLMREECPVASITQKKGFPGHEGPATWLLTRYDHASKCLANTSDFSSQANDYPVRPWIPQAIDPPKHTSYRRMMNKWFTPDAMTAMEPHLEEYAEELIDKMLEKDEFDFVADFSDRFPTVIFCQLMGFPTEDYEILMDRKNVLMHANDGHSRGHALAVAHGREIGLDIPEGEPLTSEVELQIRGSIAISLYEYFGELLEKRREKPQDNLISQLIVARFDNERPLSEEELLDTMFLFYMGGLDTVASVLGLVVKTFAENPTKRREFVELMEDPSKLNAACEELVRYHSIVLLPRRATRDVEVGGVSIAAEENIMCPTQACNRDPDEFENPDELIYDRVPNRHMGYGHGPHRCLGIHLARRELKIGLLALHRKLPDYELHPDRKPELFAGMKGASSVWLRKVQST